MNTITSYKTYGDTTLKDITFIPGDTSSRNKNIVAELMKQLYRAKAINETPIASALGSIDPPAAARTGYFKGSNN